MSTWGWVAVGAIAVVLVGVLLLPLVAGEDEARITTALHEAAKAGKQAKVESSIEQGVDVDGLDERGMTALHHAAGQGHLQTTTALVKLGADPNIVDDRGMTALAYALEAGHSRNAKVLRGTTRAGTRVARRIEKARAASKVQGLSPSLKYTDAASFSAAIGRPATVLKSEHVYLFAAKSLKPQAEIVFPYLVKAYDALYKIVGVHTEYIMVVYHFPQGHPEAFGGTTDWAIWYTDANLRLERHPEWVKHKVPHVSGYIEEMAHNFVTTVKVQFGWEMVGWSIGELVTLTVAHNPVAQTELFYMWRMQEDTFRRYEAAGHVLPLDVPANEVDQIHAYLLRQCALRYGKDFWRDFFTEVRKVQGPLRDALALGEGAATRNERYRITVECFDRLRGVGFSEMLREARISRTVSIKSLNPTQPGWNRRLQ